jgi:hypothetical protein
MYGGLLQLILRPENAKNTHVIPAHVYDANWVVANSVFRKRIDETLDVSIGHIGRGQRRSLGRRRKGYEQE